MRCGTAERDAGDLVGVLGDWRTRTFGDSVCVEVRVPVVGIGRGPENEALAKKLGAFAYIDTKATKARKNCEKWAERNCFWQRRRTRKR